MTYTNSTMSFGNCFPLFLRYWNCTLNRGNRELYEIFVETTLIYEKTIKKMEEKQLVH